MKIRKGMTTRRFNKKSKTKRTENHTIFMTPCVKTCRRTRVSLFEEIPSRIYVKTYRHGVSTHLLHPGLHWCRGIYPWRTILVGGAEWGDTRYS